MLWMTRLLLLGTPLGLIIGWGVSTGIEINPSLLGESISCLLGFSVLWTLTMVYWCLNHHRLTNAVVFGFCVAFMLLGACLIFFVYDHFGDFEYRTATAVYLCFNMLFVCKLHFDWTASVEDFPEYCKTFETHNDRWDAAALPPADCTDWSLQCSCRSNGLLQDLQLPQRRERAHSAR